MIGIKMDMPKKCGECPIRMSVYGTDVFYCPAIRQRVYEGCDENRHPDCPLCELPEDDKIRVGDEVHNFNRHGIVVFIWKDGDVDVVTKSGKGETWGRDGIERTGRHFDDVVMMLKKMRGEDDD
jgi:hypothetical protein